VGIRHGAAASKVAEEIIAWAQRKHAQIRQEHPYASLDRLPISMGPDPELWVQLDLRYPERLGWTISLSTDDGSITLQFQYMKAPPFDTIEGRKQLFDAVAALPGVNVRLILAIQPTGNAHLIEASPARGSPRETVVLPTRAIRDVAVRDARLADEKCLWLPRLTRAARKPRKTPDNLRRAKR
jgi:hypothetical protein